MSKKEKGQSVKWKNQKKKQNEESAHSLNNCLQHKYYFLELY